MAEGKSHAIPSVKAIRLALRETKSKNISTSSATYKVSGHGHLSHAVTWLESIQMLMSTGRDSTKGWENTVTIDDWEVKYVVPLHSSKLPARQCGFEIEVPSTQRTI